MMTFKSSTEGCRVNTHLINRRAHTFQSYCKLSAGSAGQHRNQCTWNALCNLLESQDLVFCFLFFLNKKRRPNLED